MATRCRKVVSEVPCHPVEVIQGATYAETFALSDPADESGETPLDLTDATVADSDFVMITSDDEIVLISTSECTFVDRANGIMSRSMTPAQTALFPLKQVVKHDLYVTFSSGLVVKPFEGPVLVTRKYST